jgi:hypothetical protein
MCVWASFVLLKNVGKHRAAAELFLFAASVACSHILIIKWSNTIKQELSLVDKCVDSVATAPEYTRRVCLLKTDF